MKREKRPDPSVEDERDDAERKRKAAGAVVARATSLAREGKPRDDDSGSDSASDSGASSDPDFDRSRTLMSLSERCYSPYHYWEDGGQESWSECDRRQRRGRRNLK